MDLQFIQFNDSLSLNGVHEVHGAVPRTLEIQGPDMRSAIEVYVNDHKSPSFIVVNNTTILAQVPDGVAKTTVTNVSVLSSNFTATVRSQLRFRISTEPKACSGLRALMQTYLKILFTTPGTDAFLRTVGGAVMKNIGRQIDIHQGNELISDFAISVALAETQMKAIQAPQTRIADDERLLSATLLDIRFDVPTTSLIARIELISQSGIRAITNLEL